MIDSSISCDFVGDGRRDLLRLLVIQSVFFFTKNVIYNNL